MFFIYFFSLEINDRNTIPLQGADWFVSYAYKMHIGLTDDPTMFSGLYFLPSVMLIS